MAKGVTPFSHGAQEFTRMMKTVALRAALDDGQYDIAVGGARRDEERSRAKERIFTLREAGHRWEPRNQRPEFWHTVNNALTDGQTMRVFPLSNWSELDIWRYVARENLEVVPLYFPQERPVVERQGALIMVDDDRMEFEPGEEPADAPGPVPVAGRLPAVGRGRGRSGRRRRHHPRHRGEPAVRAGRPADRRRGRAVDGAQEGGGLLLMKALIRVVVCGSVDDGKSTLLGRLLAETGSIPEDQLELARFTRRAGFDDPGRGDRLQPASPTAWRPNVSRASPSTWPTGT